MNNFFEVNLSDFLDSFKDNENIYIKDILQSFKCSKNKDVESFLIKNAINFTKQKIAITYLIFEYKENNQNPLILLGYYTLSNKSIIIKTDTISKNNLKTLKKFGHYNEENQILILPIILIAQIGKNSAIENNSLSGEEILNNAYEKIKLVHNTIGGKYVYLDCEDNEKIIKFYENNGFKRFDQKFINNNKLLKFIKKV